MIQPASLASLISSDRIAPTQRAIVATVDALMTGVSVVKHPGKVDLSELVAKSIVQAPGIGIGWSRIRTPRSIDGHYSLTVDWTAYIVAEAKAVDQRRVEKEEVAIAIGSRLLQILADADHCMWDLSGISPPDMTPGPEFKPLFTVADSKQGTVYYAVTWSQTLNGLGGTYLPTAVAQVIEGEAALQYPSPDDLAEMDSWLASGSEVSDA